MMFPNVVMLADRVALVDCGQSHGEFFEILELISNINFVTVHENRENGLRGTSIVNCLAGEEQSWIIVVKCLTLLRLLLPLE